MSAIERELVSRGFRAIAGTDEVGRGALAGPVVAAAVVLDSGCTILGAHDSKQLGPEDRRIVFRLILSRARAVAVAAVEPPVIDRLNILRASKLAMRQAVESLELRPEILLIDAIFVETLQMPQIPLIAGDARSVSIAAASIVAKVYRDLLMESYHALYPQYDFINNRGYGTEAHLKALHEHGLTPIHRRSFSPVGGATLFD
jgi:ribonuclease HII